MDSKRQAQIVFLIPASSAWENQLDQVAQKASWAKELPEHIKVFWYVGRQNEVEEVVGDILYLDCQDGYDYILKKTIFAIRWVIKNEDFDIVVRTNTSTYFDLKRTQEVVKSYQSEDIKVGGFLEQANLGKGKSKVRRKFITGTGIVMSREAVKLLGSSNLDNLIGVPDDIAISSYFLSHNIPLLPTRRGNLSVARFFIPNWQIRLKASDNSRLASSRFPLIHEYFNASGIVNRVVAFLRIQANEFKNFEWRVNYIFTFFRNFVHILKLNALRKFTRYE